jgi:antitoxin FitA
MAQLVVRNLEQSLKLRLQRRAKRNGRSMEEEVREILRDAVHASEKPSAGLGTQIAAMFAGKGLNSDIRELRGDRIHPMSFEENHEP